MSIPAALNAFRLFDAHLHVIDGRFPLFPNHGYVPDGFTCADYLDRMRGYDLAGGAVVAGSFQGFDQTWLIAALATLGAGFVGVAQVPAAITDAELLALDCAGVRGLRFNLKRGDAGLVRQLDRLARRVHELVGWHVELYVDAKDLAALAGVLVTLPAVSIDHLGLTRDGFDSLLQLVGRGVHVKASGFGRVDFDVKPAIRSLFAANPQALMFGSDLPSTRAPRPFTDDDFRLVIDLLGPEQAGQVFYTNAARFYRLAER